MDTNELMDGVRKLVLMNIGAVATAADKGKEVASELIARGEQAVDEGKSLNQELSHKAQEVADKGLDSLLKAHLSGLSSTERADFVARVASIATEVSEAEPTHVEVEDAPEGTHSES